MFKKNPLLAKSPSNPFADLDSADSPKMAKYYAEYRPLEIYRDVIRRLKTERSISSDKNKRPFTNVLDIGCGTGPSTFAFENEDCVEEYIYGLEPAENMLDLAIEMKEKRKSKKIFFYRGSVEEMHQLFKPKQFDLVTMANTFRLVNPQLALNQIAKVLSNSGIFVIYYYSLYGIEGEDKEKFSTWLHSQFFKKYSVVSQGRRFSPDPTIPLKEFKFSSEQTYDKTIIMDIKTLVGLLMSTSGVFNAVKKLNSNPLEIQAYLLSELDPFFKKKTTVSFVFRISILQWERCLRTTLEHTHNIEEHLLCKL